VRENASVAVGVKVTTPVDASKLDVPATEEPFDVTASAAVDALVTVAVIAAFTRTFVAEAAGVFAVSAGFGLVVNDHVPPDTAAPSAVAVTV
jgi:hypothetical protein